MLIVLGPILYIILLAGTVFSGILFLCFDSQRQTGWKILGAAGGSALGIVSATVLVLGSVALLSHLFDVESFGRRYDPYFPQEQLLLFWLVGVAVGSVLGAWCVNKLLKRAGVGRR
jgi:hypothetical protein